MEKLATENLFLLEFLVDEINLTSNLRNNLQYFVGETCVMFQFLDNNPFYIEEKDFYPEKCQGCDPNMQNKNGKSCLFSMKPKEAENALKKFDVFVEVFKHPDGDFNKKVMIGKTKICVVEIFRAIVESIIGGHSMITKTLKDDFELKNDNGQFVGHISAYLRLTCFGKLIITNFQMDLGEKLNITLESNDKNKSSRRPGSKNKSSALCELEPKFADVCAALNNQNPQIEDQFSSNSLDESSRLSCGDPSCKHCYQPPPCLNNFPQQSSRPLPNVFPLQKLALRTNCKGKEDRPFEISMPKNFKSLNIIPPTCTSPDGSKFTEISDPKRELFVMRIKKKTEGEPSPKSKIDLELNTPVPSPPPALREHHKCQYSLEDLSNEYLESYYGKQMYALIKKGLNPLCKQVKGLK